MELQMKQFWILKGHSTIKSANEYEPDEVNTGLKTQSLLRMYELISAFANQQFWVF